MPPLKGRPMIYHTWEQKAGALALYSLGCRIDAIEALMEVSRPTIYKWVKQMGGPNRGHGAPGQQRRTYSGKARA